MGVDTKGVILTNEKDFWKVSQRIGNALYGAIRPHIERMQTSEDGRWKLPTVSVAMQAYLFKEHPAEMFHFNFIWQGQSRHMSVHTDCDCDLQDEFGEGTKGIIISLGHNDISVEVIETVLKAVADMGDVYIQRNDCTDDYELLENKVE